MWCGGGSCTMASLVQHASRKRWSTGLSALLVTFLLISACASGANSSAHGDTSPTASVPSGATTTPAAESIILAMLNNVKTNGWDNNSAINNGLGGLWVNWRYGTSPLQVNLNGTG